MKLKGRIYFLGTGWYIKCLNDLGYVLSREALTRFVTKALRDKGKKDSCRTKDDDGAEDAEIGKCLSGVEVVSGDSRDKDGKERFFPFNPNTQLISSNIPQWYWKLMYYDSKNVSISGCIIIE